VAVVRERKNQPMPLAEPCPKARLPRELHDMARMRRGAAAARRGGQSAMAVALAEIDAAFDAAAAVNGFKLRVEQIMRLGPTHPAVRARFGARAQMLCGRDLPAAVVAVERWWRDERKAFAIACAFGRGTRLSLEVLRELRLILRLLRLKRMQAEYEAVLAAMYEAPLATAAEWCRCGIFMRSREERCGYAARATAWR
jgi:hypothetical protein